MEKSGQRERIVITEIPFMTDKSNLIQKMADLVTNKVIPYKLTSFALSQRENACSMKMPTESVYM